MFYRVATICISALLFSSSVCLAKEKNIKDAFCSKLKDEQAYVDSNFEYHKYFIPGHQNWIFRTKNDIRLDYAVADRTRAYLLALQEALRMKGTELVIVFPPVRGLVHAAYLRDEHLLEYGLTDTDTIWGNYERSLQELRQAGINIVGVNQDEADSRFFYKRDHHWSASGAKITAKKAAAFIKKRPVYSDIPKKEFVTAQQGTVSYNSSFDKAFHTICGTRIPPEIAKQYVTAEKESETVSERAELTEPDIVLVGTSNSVNEASLANFEGFLSDYLSADIMNRSYVGAGIDTPIMAYLNSNHFKQGKADILIWEVPGYYDLNMWDDELFKKIIPAAYGGCNDDAIIETTVNIKKGDTEIFDFSIEIDGSKEDLKSHPLFLPDNVPLYVKMEFSRPVEKDFAVEFQFRNNGTKKQYFEGGSSYLSGSEFYTLLPIAQNAAELDKVRIEASDELEDLAVGIQICPLPEDSPLAKVS